MPGVFFKSRCVVSMCAVIGYSVGRTSAQPRSQSRAANVERSAQLLLSTRGWLAGLAGGMKAGVGFRNSRTPNI